MKTVLHKADSRGVANLGWLNSRHTFSFSHYYDPQRLHFGALRVLNDDRVAAGMGFGTHPHENMEIISIPLAGDLEHRDSMGNSTIIRQGDVQIMSAGTGVKHSEFNHSKSEEVKFLQIWVLPKAINITPRYDQKTFDLSERINKWQTIVAPGDDNAIRINQDAWFTLGNLSTPLTYQLNDPSNGVYIFVLSGEVEVNGQVLSTRDGMGVTEAATIDFKPTSQAEVLLMEVPMLVLK
jgi:redox-sensitive bicupin YhaK (pirin superfamily)